MLSQRHKDIEAIDRSILDLQNQLKMSHNELDRSDILELIELDLEIRACILLDHYEELSPDQQDCLDLIRKSFGQ